MLAPNNSPSPIRPIGLAVPQMPPEVCVGVPSCDPLVQHELLKAIRQRIPHAYARAGQELSLTVAQTKELIDKRVEIVSAARAIKLVRMIAYEPNARDVVGEAGRQLLSAYTQRFPRLVRNAIRFLPRPLRIWLALVWMRSFAHGFAGSTHRIFVVRRHQGLAVTILNGLFSDRLDTLGCAHTYYRNVLESVFRQLAGVDCKVAEVRRSRVHLNRCSFEIVWRA